MTFQVGSTCYGSQGSALSAIASGQSGAVVVHGGSAYVVGAAPTTGGINYSFTAADGSGTFMQFVSISPEPCGLLQAEDGGMLGMLVMSVWALAFGFRIVTRYLWDSSAGGGNDS